MSLFQSTPDNSSENRTIRRPKATVHGKKGQGKLGEVASVHKRNKSVGDGERVQGSMGARERGRDGAEEQGRGVNFVHNGAGELG